MYIYIYIIFKVILQCSELARGCYKEIFLKEKRVKSWSFPSDPLLHSCITWISYAIPETSPKYVNGAGTRLRTDLVV